MLFHKDKQIAFVLNPKSGSTSARAFLLSLGMNHVPTDENEYIIARVHLAPDVAFSKYPNLTTYKTYGFFRNPLDRFMSGINNIHEKVELKNFAKLFDKNYFPHTLFRPQTDWLNYPNVTTLDFDNYKAEMGNIAAMLDAAGQYPKKINVTKNVYKQEPTPEIEAFVREKYAVDYQFAKDVLGKEY